MRRRHALLAAGAVAAGSAGFGLAWWRGRSEQRPMDVDVWSMHFRQPDDRELRMVDFRGRPVLLNFWATWCPPCVSELPLLDRFHRDQMSKGWQVVGLAVDNRVPVLEFLKLHPVSFSIGLAGLEGVDLARAMGNVGGALPFTVVFDRTGLVIDRKLGVIRPDDLQSWAQRVG